MKNSKIYISPEKYMKCHEKKLCVQIPKMEYISSTLNIPKGSMKRKYLKKRISKTY